MALDSRFGKIYGRTTDDEVKGRKQLESWDADGLNEDVVREVELKKEAREIEIIEAVNETVRKFVTQYKSVTPPVDIKKIHLVPQGYVQKLSNNNYSNAYYSTAGNYIAIERTETSTGFARALIHELLHLYGYHAFFGTREGKPKLYRDGLKMYDKARGLLFSDLNEATVAMLTDRVLQDFSQSNTLLLKEAAGTQNRKTRLNETMEAADIPEQARITALLEIEFLSEEGLLSLEKLLTEKGYPIEKFEKLIEDLNRMDATGKAAIRERSLEIRELSRLFEQIIGVNYEKKHTLLDKKIILDMFARAYFTGDIISIAQIVDDAFGKGSFRDFGNDFTIPGIKTTAQSLDFEIPPIRKLTNFIRTLKRRIFRR